MLMMNRLRMRIAFAAFIAACCVSPFFSWADGIPEPIGEEAYSILSAWYDYDATIPLEARVVELTETDTTVRRKVVFRGTRSFLVPGYLEFPKNAEPPYRCVVLCHGWSGGKQNWWEDGNYISGGDARKALVEKGYAVFALDAQGHGDRIAENDYHVVNLHNEPDAVPRKNYFSLREIVSQTVVDYRRGLDYLAKRGDIDMDRIGLLGYSMGGFHTFALTAVEPRIKVVAGCVVPVTWSDDPILAPANYARGIGDRPFCMLMGKEDPMCDEAQAKQLYALIEGPDTELHLYDAGHRLPVDYVKDAVTFIAGRL
jgi:dienelactone hydrolase